MCIVNIGFVRSLLGCVTRYTFPEAPTIRNNVAVIVGNTAFVVEHPRNLVYVRLVRHIRDVRYLVVRERVLLGVKLGINIFGELCCRNSSVDQLRAVKRIFLEVRAGDAVVFVALQLRVAYTVVRNLFIGDCLIGDVGCRDRPSLYDLLLRHFVGVVLVGDMLCEIRFDF